MFVICNCCNRKKSNEINYSSDCNGTRTSTTLSALVHLARILNGWVFIYKLSCCGFEALSCHLNLRYRISFEQEISWPWGNCRVYINFKRVFAKHTQRKIILLISFWFQPAPFRILLQSEDSDVCFGKYLIPLICDLIKIICEIF